MNNEFSQGEFSLDVGERLLQGMQALRDELNTFGDQVQTIIARAQTVVPLKQRRQPITRPMTVTAICNYKKNDVSWKTVFQYLNVKLSFCFSSSSKETKSVL